MRRIGRGFGMLVLFLHASGAALIYGFLLPSMTEIQPPERPEQATVAAALAMLMLAATWWGMYRRGISEISDRWLGATVLCLVSLYAARWIRFGDPDAEWRLFMRIVAASVAVGWILVALWQRYRRRGSSAARGGAGESA